MISFHLQHCPFFLLSFTAKTGESQKKPGGGEEVFAVVGMGSLISLTVILLTIELRSIGLWKIFLTGGVSGILCGWIQIEFNT